MYIILIFYMFIQNFPFTLINYGGDDVQLIGTNYELIQRCFRKDQDWTFGYVDFSSGHFQFQTKEGQVRTCPSLVATVTAARRADFFAWKNILFLVSMYDVVILATVTPGSIPLKIIIGSPHWHYLISNSVLFYVDSLA